MLTINDPQDELSMEMGIKGKKATDFGRVSLYQTRFSHLFL